MTKIVLNSDELTAKRVELVHELLPISVPIALLVNPSNPNVGDSVMHAQQAARAVSWELIVVGATTKSETEAAFEAMDRQHAGGLVVWQEAYFTFVAHGDRYLSGAPCDPCHLWAAAFPRDWWVDELWT